MRVFSAIILFAMVLVLLSNRGNATPTPTPTATPTVLPHQNVAIISNGNAASVAHPFPVRFP